MGSWYTGTARTPTEREVRCEVDATLFARSMKRSLLLVALALAALAAGDDIPWDSHREKAKAREAYAAQGITAAQRAELENMLETIADLVAELNVPSKLQEDADLYTLDNLRLLHGKLVSLKRVAKLTEPEEWDAMIQALLASKHYGVDDLEARLRPGKQPLTAEACEADGSGAPLLDDAEDAGLPERVGRRLRETITELVDAGAQLGVVQRVGAWAWAILDRPTPWERDCDCCFRECPEEHVCLLQSDGLLLACRGESVGEKLAVQWAERPLACLAGALAAFLLLFWCCMPTTRRVRPVAADDSDDSDDDDDDDDSSGGDDGEAGDDDDGDGGVRRRRPDPELLPER